MWTRRVNIVVFNWTLDIKTEDKIKCDRVRDTRPDRYIWRTIFTRYDEPYNNNTRVVLDSVYFLFNTKLLNYYITIDRNITILFFLLLLHFLGKFWLHFLRLIKIGCIWLENVLQPSWVWECSQNICHSTLLLTYSQQEISRPASTHCRQVWGHSPEPAVSNRSPVILCWGSRSDRTPSPPSPHSPSYWPGRSSRPTQGRKWSSCSV